jgi:hypothetical protein
MWAGWAINLGHDLSSMLVVDGTIFESGKFRVKKKSKRTTAKIKRDH